MKKQLLMLGLGLIGGLSAMAQTAPFKGADAPGEGQKGDFYLYNIGTGMWLQNNDDHDRPGPYDAEMWSTRAELGKRGMDIEVSYLGDDGLDMFYKLNPKFGRNHSINWGNLYMDTGAEVTQWIFEPAEDEENPKAFRIVANHGDYGFLIADANGFLGVRPEEEIEGKNGLWLLVTRDERLDYMTSNATMTNPMDATWLIAAPSLPNADERMNQWIRRCSHDGSDGKLTVGPIAAHGGDGMVHANRIQEFWSTWSASMTQQIKNIPNGTYGFNVQGYYREGSAHERDFKPELGFLPAYDVWAADEEHHYAKYFANGETGDIMSIFANAKDAREDGYQQNAITFDVDFETTGPTGKWVPNSTDQASLAFFQDRNAYRNPEIKTSVADNILNIGIRKEQGVQDDWIIVDDFQLQYYGAEIDLSMVKNALTQAIAAGEACTARSTDALNKQYEDAMAAGKNILENSSDAAEIAGAANTINDVVALLKATEGNAALLKATIDVCKKQGMVDASLDAAADVIANGVTADAVNSGLDNLRMGRRLWAADKQENVFKGNAPAEGQFYLYNVGQKRFFCGGESWGAHAALGFPGIELTLEAAEAEGAFKINTRLKNGDGQVYLNYGGYCDTGAQDPWTFEEVGNGVYVIKRTNASEEEKANGNCLLGYRPGRYAVVDTDMNGTDVDGNQWILVTKEDRDALLETATKENPVDASYMIKMPNFNQREYEIDGGWDSDNGAWMHQGGVIYDRGQDRADFAFEAYNVEPFVISQEIEGLKPGYYVVGVQGYYRGCGENEDNGDYYQKIADGETPAKLANLIASTSSEENNGEFSTPLVTIETGSNMLPGYGRTFVKNGMTFTAPLNPGDATNFFQVGLYKNYLLCEVGEDGYMFLAVEKNGGLEHDWICLDNFRLTYYGTEKPELTGIDGIKDVETVKDGKIYNIQGVQVKSATQRGIYIKNGKKFVVKK